MTISGDEVIKKEGLEIPYGSSPSKRAENDSDDTPETGQGGGLQAPPSFPCWSPYGPLSF